MAANLAGQRFCWGTEGIKNGQQARGSRPSGAPQYVGLIARVFNSGSQPLHLDWDNFELVRWSLHPSTPTASPIPPPVTIIYQYDSLYRLTSAVYSDLSTTGNHGD